MQQYLRGESTDAEIPSNGVWGFASLSRDFAALREAKLRFVGAVATEEQAMHAAYDADRRAAAELRGAAAGLPLDLRARRRHPAPLVRDGPAALRGQGRRRGV